MMNYRKHLLEAVTLIVAAVVIALVANAFASRERKLVVVSNSGSTAPRPTPKPEPAPVSAVPPVSTEPPLVAAPKTATQPPLKSSPGRPTPLEPTKSVKQAMVNAPAAKEFNPHPDKPYIELHGDDVAALHAKGILFLDARRTSVYEQGHIPGARPFSVWESDVDDKVNKLLSERPDAKDQNLPIVIYCSGGDCEDSHMLAQKLWGVGFNNAYVYKDGFPDWQKRGEPVHTGTAP